MVKKFTASREQLKPDTRFNSLLVSKFVNCLMYDGKKSVASGAFYRAMEIVEKQLPNENPLDVFVTAVDNVKPAIEVRSKRVGGATYQVPVEVRSSRRQTLAMRWIIDAARKRGEKSMRMKLAGELMDASEQRGSAVKKREDTHRMAEANKAFAHYRW